MTLRKIIVESKMWQFADCDVDAVGELHKAITAYILSLLPKVIHEKYDKGSCSQKWKEGYNQALADIKERIENQ
jgi:hypothetical protein